MIAIHIRRRGTRSGLYSIYAYTCFLSTLGRCANVDSADIVYSGRCSSAIVPAINARQSALPCHNFYMKPSLHYDPLVDRCCCRCWSFVVVYHISYMCVWAPLVSSHHKGRSNRIQSYPVLSLQQSRLQRHASEHNMSRQCAKKRFVIVIGYCAPKKPADCAFLVSIRSAIGLTIP